MSDTVATYSASQDITQSLSNIIPETDPKAWVNLTDNEKIERLREYAQKTEKLEKKLNKLESSYLYHFHINGKVVHEADYDMTDETFPLFTEDKEKPKCEQCEKTKYI